MTDFIGWVGGILLAICSFPQALKSFNDGHSRYVPNMLLVLWGTGEFFALLYVFIRQDYPLLLNYFLNILSFSVILRYKLFERQDYGIEYQIQE